MTTSEKLQAEDAYMSQRREAERILAEAMDRNAGQIADALVDLSKQVGENISTILDRNEYSQMDAMRECALKIAGGK